MFAPFLPPSPTVRVGQCGGVQPSRKRCRVEALVQLVIFLARPPWLWRVTPFILLCFLLQIATRLAMLSLSAYAIHKLRQGRSVVFILRMQLRGLLRRGCWTARAQAARSRADKSTLLEPCSVPASERGVFTGKGVKGDVAQQS